MSVKRTGEVMSKKTKLLIVGGVAAGASAAARARRLSEEAEIVVLERGPDVSFANCGLPYHIGGEIARRESLAVQTPESLRALLNLDVRAGTEAVEIDRAGKRLKVRPTGGEEETWLDYDKLLLAPGASPLRPPLPGIDDPRVHTLRNLQDMDRIAGAVQEAELPHRCRMVELSRRRDAQGLRLERHAQPSGILQPLTDQPPKHDHGLIGCHVVELRAAR